MEHFLKWCTLESTSPGVVLQFSREVREIFPKILNGLASGSENAMGAAYQNI